MKTWLGKLATPNAKTLLLLVLLLAAATLFRSWYMTPNASQGEIAADFSAINAAGASFKLSDYRGAPVLLHFWGSWCGPCRRNNPELVALAQAEGSDLKIISIAIEKNRERWLAAIQRDGLFWPDQVFDQTTSTKFMNGPISDLYGVNEVPTEILLDDKGVVVQVNPTIAEIRKFLANAR